MMDRRPRILPAAWRRGLLFVCGIAGPVLAGFWFGAPEAALPAGVTGLLLCWAESAGSLSDRLRALAIVAGAMTIGAMLGLLTQGSAAILWSVALVGGCGVGYAATKDGLWPLATRDGAIAFAVGTILPPPTVIHGSILTVGLGLIIVSRILDHALGGPLPVLSGAQPLDKPTDGADRARFALAHGIAATVALAVGWQISPDYAPWVVITTLVVMQPDAGASYRRVLLRIVGALLGVAGAWVTLYVVRTPVDMIVAIAILAACIPHHFHRRYWLHTALIAWTVLLMHAVYMQSQGAIDAMIDARLADMVIGAIIAALGTWAAFAQWPGSDT